MLTGITLDKLIEIKEVQDKMKNHMVCLFDNYFMICTRSGMLSPKKREIRSLTDTLKTNGL